MKKYIWLKKDGLFGVELLREIPMDGDKCYGGMIFWFKTEVARSMFLIYSDKAETDKIDWILMKGCLIDSVVSMEFNWDLNGYGSEYY